jgi:hypothetical protein
MFRRRAGAALVIASVLAIGSPGAVLALTADSFTFPDLIMDQPLTFNPRGTNQILEPTIFYPDPAHGTIQIDAPLICEYLPMYNIYECIQQITYVPDPGFVGTDTWHYTVHDPLNGGDAFGFVSMTFVHDVTAPVGTLDPNSADSNSGAGWTNRPSLSVGVGAIDDYSGVSRVRLANTKSGGALVRPRTFDYPGTITNRLAWSLASGRVIVGTRAASASLPPGTYTVFAQWRDGAGNWSAVKSATIKLDPYTPTLPAITVGAGWNRFAPGIPLHLAFPASDTGGSGVELYELQQSVNGGAFVDAGFDANGGFVDLVVSPANSYRFRARARDLAGSWTPWVSTTPFKAVEVDESSSSIAYTGSWRDVGSSKMTMAAGATAKLTFSGRTIAWAAVRGPTKGKASVYVDGALVKTIDLYSPTVQNSFEAFRRTWATSGTHTILVKALGTTGRPEVHIDWLLIVK